MFSTDAWYVRLPNVTPLLPLKTSYCFVCVCTHMRKLEVDIRCLSQLLGHLSWVQGSHLTRSSWTGHTGWPKEPQKSYLCSSTLSATVTDMYIKLASHGCQDMNWGPHACTAGQQLSFLPSLTLFFLPHKSRKGKADQNSQHKCNNFLPQLWQHLICGLAVTLAICWTQLISTLSEQTLRTSAPGSKPAFWTHCFKHTISPLPV